MAEKKTPSQWAAAKGQACSPFYGGAIALHGWNEHEHHTGAPIQLTEADYDGAVAAVADKKDGFTPHWPAASPHAAAAKLRPAEPAEENAQ